MDIVIGLNFSSSTLKKSMILNDIKKFAYFTKSHHTQNKGRDELEA